MTQDKSDGPLTDLHDEGLPDPAEKFGGKEADHTNSADQQDGDLPTGHAAEDRPPANNSRGPFAQDS